MHTGSQGFQLNRCIPIGNGEFLVQWVETGVDTSIRWPWQHSVICTSAAAALETGMISTPVRYQQVRDRADRIETRTITSIDIGKLVASPTRFYPELQGRGGWW